MENPFKSPEWWDVKKHLDTRLIIVVAVPWLILHLIFTAIDNKK